MGRWSRQAAYEFLSWLEPQPNLRWLEMGCGTGALTEAILEQANPISILACDPSEALLGIARERIRDPRVSFEVSGAASCQAYPSRLDVFASGLVLNFIDDPKTAVGSIAQKLTDGGLVAAYVWDYSQGMEFLRVFWDAAVALDPNAADLDEGKRFPLCSPAPLRSLFESVGLSNIEVTSLETITRFDSFSDYWTPFLGGTGPAPNYVSSLGDDERQRLEKDLRTRLSPEGDGSLVLTARAWGVRGST